MGLVFIGLLTALGICLMGKPDWFWRLTHPKKMQKNRPDERFLNAMRSAGTVCIGLAAFLLVCYFRQ